LLPAFLFFRAHLFLRKMFVILVVNWKTYRVSFYSAKMFRLNAWSWISYFRKENLHCCNVCATHLRCGRFRIRFLPRKIRADATNPGLLIRNEKMDGFLVSRYSTPKVTCSQCYEIAYFIYHLKPIIAQDIHTLYMKYKLHLRLQLYIS